MPKINVYLSQWLADAVRDADLPVSDICQRALAEAVGRKRPMTNTNAAAPKAEWWKSQPYEERVKDLVRAAAAVRYLLEPGPNVPVIIKPIGAAIALSAIRHADPSVLEWETKAQDVAGCAAAVEVAAEVGASAAVLELLREKLAAAEADLAAVKVSKRFGAKPEVLDLIAELQERTHPQRPR
jgi:ATP-dependent Clp protease ATP-binding subunit ClpC